MAPPLTQEQERRRQAGLDPYGVGLYDELPEPVGAYAPSSAPVDPAWMEEGKMPPMGIKALRDSIGLPEQNPTGDAAADAARMLAESEGVDPMGPPPVDPMEAIKAAYGPERVVMGKDVTTGEEYSGTRESAYQNKPGLVLDPQTKDNIKAAYLLQEQGVNKRAEAQWKGAEAERLKREQIQAEQDKRFLEAEAAQADKIKEASLHDSLRTEPIRKKIANWELQSDRPFQGVGGWIRRIALSISAGVVGAARSEQGKGGPNPVTQMINRMIDRDIAVQKANLANMKGQLEESNSVYARLMDESKSPMEGYKQYSIYMKDKMINTLEANKALTRSEVSLANADITIADLRKSQQKDLVDLMKLEKDEEVFSKGQSMTDKEKTITKRKPVKVGGVPKSVLKGAGGKQVPQSFVDKINAKESTADIIRDGKAALAKLIKEDDNYMVAKHWPNSPAQRVYDMYMRRAARLLGEQTQKGAMSDKDAEIVDSLTARKVSTAAEGLARMNIIAKELNKSTRQDIEMERGAGYDTYGMERLRYNRELMRRVKAKKGK